MCLCFATMGMERSSSSVALLLFLVLALGASNSSSHPALAAAAQCSKTVAIVDLEGKDHDAAALAVQTHDSTPLPFSNSYHDLIGGLANLPDLPLGRASALRAVGALSSYDPAIADATAVVALKKALATLTVTPIEATRLRTVSEAVSKGWERGEARVAPEHPPYIEHWDTMSYEILRSHRTGEWGERQHPQRGGGARRRRRDREPHLSRRCSWLTRAVPDSTTPDKNKLTHVLDRGTCSTLLVPCALSLMCVLSSNSYSLDWLDCAWLSSSAVVPVDVWKMDQCVVALCSFSLVLGSCC